MGIRHFRGTPSPLRQAQDRPYPLPEGEGIAFNCVTPIMNLREAVLNTSKIQEESNECESELEIVHT